MKKLLGILATITMTGSGMTGIVGNAPTPAKNEINSFQTNNLEINKTKTISLNNYLKFINKDFKEIDEINKSIQNIAIDSQNNIYFHVSKDPYYGPDFLYIFKYKEKKITLINFSDLIPNSNGKLISLDINKKDDVYISFESDKIYLLKSGELTATKIENIPNNLIHYYIDKNNNNIYFQTNKGLYILKSGELTATKINGINTDDIIWTIYIKENIIYFGGLNGAYFLKNGETTATKINGVKNNILALAVDSQNNIYFSRWSDGLYLLKSNETKSIKINKEHVVPSSIIIDKNDNIFLGEVDVSFRTENGNFIGITDKKMNEYLDFIIDNKDNIYFGTKNYNIYTIKNNNNVIQKIKNYFTIDVHNIGSSALSCFTGFDNKQICEDGFSKRRGLGTYVLKNGEITAVKNEEINNIIVNLISIDKNNNIFFATDNGIYFKSSLDEINKNFNLGEIYSNEDKIIIANLFLEDPLFLKNKKIKIISKSSIYSKILIENGYSWSIINVNYQITNVININFFEKLLNKLINAESYNIKRELFPFTLHSGAINVSVSKIKSFVININNLSFGNVEVTRDSKLLHSVNFKEVCFKKRERINTSPVTKPFKISKCDYEQKSKLVFQITTGLTKTKQENKLNGWNINPDDEMKLHDFVNLNSKQSEIINVLSNEFDLSNTNKQEQEMILSYFSDVEDEIYLAPHERVIFKYSVGETNLENTLNLQQKISGTITAKIIDDNNEEQTITLSIKEAMQILKKYSLLPDEITLNEDNSITFNGKAKISLTQEAEPKLIMNTSIV